MSSTLFGGVKDLDDVEVPEGERVGKATSLLFSEILGFDEVRFG